MVRSLISVIAVALLTAATLAACTSAPAPAATGEPAPAASGSSGAAGGTLPACEAVATAVVALTDGLAFDADVSLAQTAPEAYAQRVCVWVSPDGTTQVGVTIAAIPFLDTEIAAYGALPNAIADERLARHGAVLQTLQVDDPADGHLDSPLYLFDLEYSVTIQGGTTGVSADLLPQLTIVDSVDAAFAVRELVP